MKAMKRAFWIVWLLNIPFAAWAASYPYQSQEKLTLYVGKVETLRLTDIERVAVGNDELLATSLLSSEELLIIPQKPGTTDLVVWQEGNRKQLIKIQVRASNPEATLKEAKLRLKLYPQLQLRIEEGTVLISGRVGTDEQLNDVIGRLSPDLIDVVRLHIRVNLISMIQESLAHIKTLQVEEKDGWIAIHGSYPPEQKDILETLLKRCGRCVNSAQEDLASEKAMVLVDVRIMEIRQRHLEKLGVRWTQAVAGPALGAAVAGGDTSLFLPFSDIGAASDIAAGLPSGFRGAAGSVGLITQFESQIDLLKESGEARMIARPMLSTRDGTPSSFHSGGEIPYPVIDARTGNVGVEFREYGVLLTILPRLSSSQGISVDIKAEVSSVDQAIAINGVPGLVSKSVSSVVTAREGETIVMSGLMSVEQDTGSSGIPWISDLPAIGRFFRSDLDDTNKRELAVFLTPHIKRSGQNLPHNSALETLSSQLKAQFPETEHSEIRHKIRD